MAGTGPVFDPVQEGIRLFNERYFFEAHEILEDAWRKERGEPRLFLQGLIQICAAYHHLQNGNMAGAVTLLERGAAKVRGYPVGYLGIDTASLLAHIEAHRHEIERARRGEEPERPIDFPHIARSLDG